MANPVTRKEQFLHAIAQGDATLLPTPVTREERFLRALSTGEKITPTTFEEYFLQAALAFKGSGGAAIDPTTVSWDGIYREKYSLGLVDAPEIRYTSSGDSYISVLIPVTPGKTITIDKGGATSILRSIFIEREPAWGTSHESFNLGKSVSHDAKLTSLTLEVPAGAMYILLFLSATGEKPPLTITEE